MVQSFKSTSKDCTTVHVYFWEIFLDWDSWKITLDFWSIINFQCIFTYFEVEVRSRLAILCNCLFSTYIMILLCSCCVMVFSLCMCVCYYDIVMSLGHNPSHYRHYRPTGIKHCGTSSRSPGWHSNNMYFYLCIIIFQALVLWTQWTLHSLYRT